LTKKELALRACDCLEILYPEAECSLVCDRNKPYQLLFAVRLSAQCTDARVNTVTEKLFTKYNSLQDFAGADIAELENIIKPCGLFRVKASDIRNAARMLIKDFNGNIPSDMKDLLKLPGVGRKSANLIRGDIFGLPAIVADTHCIRITNRLGLVSSENPVKVEKELVPLIPPQRSSDFCHRLVLFGRDICKARNPDCKNCMMNSFCSSASVDRIV